MMQRLLSTLVVLAWGLWFGAIVMVFVAVTALFATFADQRPIAGIAAASVFRRFEVLELIAAVLGLAGAAGWRFTGGRSRARTAVLALLAAAAVGACVSRFALTPRIDDLRLAGKSGTDEFKKLHGMSSSVYSAQAVLLLAAGLILPAAVAGRRDAPKD
jgi:hypothetical protein